MNGRNQADGRGHMDAGLALTGGGGLDVRIGSGISAGVDARYLYVARDPKSLNIARVAGRISYRF